MHQLPKWQQSFYNNTRQTMLINNIKDKNGALQARQKMKTGAIIYTLLVLIVGMFTVSIFKDTSYITLIVTGLILLCAWIWITTLMARKMILVYINEELQAGD